MNSIIAIAVGIIVVMVLITWALVLAAGKSAKEKKMALTTKLEELATAHNAIIDQPDFMGKKAIARDLQKNKIFYVDYSANTPRAEVFDIADVADCTILLSGSTHYGISKQSKASGQQEIDRIEIELRMHKGDKLSLLFYDEVGDGVMEMLTLKKKAEKWKAVFKK